MSDNHRYMYQVDMKSFCNTYPHMEELHSVGFDRNKFNVSFPSNTEVLVKFEGIEVRVFNITDDILAENIAVEIIRDEIRKRPPQPISISDFASLEIKDLKDE